MRKILLGTTGVVGAALFGMGAAQAQQAPTVRIGGYMQTTYAWVDDSLDYARGAPTGVQTVGNQRRQRSDFRNEVEVHVFVNGKAANGLAYGAVIEIQNDNGGASGAGTSLDLDEAYMFVTSPTLGTIRFGEEDSAASIMQVRAPSITGFGADGAWDVGILGDGGTQTGGNPSLLTGVNDGSDSTKIVYLSPQFFGFDFGFSYAPNQGEGDRAFLGRAPDVIGALGAPIGAAQTQRDYTTLTNEISAALRYRGSFQNVGIAASFVAMRADAIRNASSIGETTTTAGAGSTLTRTPANAIAQSPGGSGFRPTDVTAYSFGATVTAYGFSFGGEYTFGNYAGPSVGRRSVANNADGTALDGSSHWLLGLTYTTGPWAFGGYYGQATQDNGNVVTLRTNGVASAVTSPSDRQFTGWGIGVVYTLAPGLELFGSYNNATDDNVYLNPVASLAGQATTNTLVNRSWEGIFVGTRLAF